MIEASNHLSKKRLRTRIEGHFSYHLAPGTSICQECFKFLELIRKKDSAILKCYSCGYTYASIRPQSEDLIPPEDINIKAVDCKISSIVHPSIMAKRKLNNLRKVIEIRFGEDTYCTQPFYSSEVPKTFIVQMNFHSPKTQK